MGRIPLRKPASVAFDLDRYLVRIRAFDDARFEVATEATVASRERAYPILALARRGAEDAARAGRHGDKLAGLLAVPPILEAWRSELSRVNASGDDMNRDFVRFATASPRPRCATCSSASVPIS